jgi:hypothetical protein
MHQATFDRWFHSPLGGLLCGCAAALVLRPNRIGVLIVTAAVEFAYLLQGMPETANHLLFECLVCITWLLTYGVAAVTSRRRGATWWQLWRGELNEPHPLGASLPPLKVALLLLYWLSVLHKLNYDFLDPEVSCASYMYRRVSEVLPLPKAVWAEYLSIWGTLLAEAAVPALLLYRRTWRLGLVAALLFHLLLGFDPTPGIYSFTGLLYALFILLLPDEFVATAGQELRALRARVGDRVLLYLRLAGLLLWGAILVNTALRGDRWSFGVGFPIFVLWALLVGTAYLVTLVRTPRTPALGPAPSPGSRRRTPIWLWGLPCLVVLNGFNPYLGLRTQLSFSMFSNLRTEGGRSNHLFMPRLATLAPYQDDLVEVLDSDTDSVLELKKQELLLPYFEFRQVVAEFMDVHITYRHHGEVRRFDCVDGNCNDPELATKYPRLLRAFFYFRPVDKGPKMHCRH